MDGKIFDCGNEHTYDNDNEYTSDNDHEYTFYDYVDANGYCRSGTPP